MNRNMNARIIRSQEMQNKLLLFVEFDEINKDSTSKASIIQNWVTTISCAWKAQATNIYIC